MTGAFSGVVEVEITGKGVQPAWYHKRHMTNEGVPISRDMLVALECVLLRRMHNGTIKTIRWKVVKDGS